MAYEPVEGCENAPDRSPIWYRSSGGAHRPKEIVAKLRRVDVLVSQGQSVAEAVRSIGVTQFTYYRWRKEFGGLKTDQMKQLRASTRSSATVIEYDHLNGEVFYGLAEARIMIEAWRVYSDTARPHSSLGYRPPARSHPWALKAERDFPSVVARLGTSPCHELRLEPEHPMGAGQHHSRRARGLTRCHRRRDRLQGKRLPQAAAARRKRAHYLLAGSPP